MTRIHPALASALLVVLAAAPATAQSAIAQSATPPPAPPAASIRAFVLVGDEQLAASQTFNATMGTSKALFYGGGAEVDLRSGLFVRVSASRYRKTGQRALDLEGQVYQLGIPLTVSITPVEFTAGFRFQGFGRFVPYAGGGGGTYGYTEESKFAGPSENVNDRFTGYHVLGGADVRVTGWLHAGGEVQYTSVGHALGQGGLSQQYGETNLGGTTVKLLVSVGR